MTDTRSRGNAPLAPVGVVLAIGGFALLVVEVVRTLNGAVFGTIGTTLLWVGVGVLAVGLLLLVLSLVADDEVMADQAAVNGVVGNEVAPAASVDAPPPPPPLPAPPPPPPPPVPAATAPVEALSPVVDPTPPVEPAPTEPAPTEPGTTEAAPVEQPPASAD